MRVIADLHIHSRYSRATSPRLTPAYLDRWARIKGIGLMGAGDCTHPRWLAELRDNFEDAEPGLYTLKNNIRAAFDSGPALAEELPLPEPDSPVSAETTPRFALTGEISTIYKRDGKTRKVHHVIILPDFRAAAMLQTKLARAGNITSDGRPILGLDSRDLFAMALDTDERSLLIPAHIWTPWFSALGAQSGFDSIEECYGNLAAHIPAIETGLSSDPPMNWALSSLDRYAIISSSDAHSPDKLGREATILDMEISFAGLRNALFSGCQTKRTEGSRADVLATVEFFPEEGKYHYDGHRKCGVCLEPGNTAVTVAGETACPVCGKPLTRGVMGRVMELADRTYNGTHNEKTRISLTGNRRPFHSLIPLREMLGEILGTGPGSKKAAAAYGSLIEKVGNELTILMEMPLAAIGRTQAGGVSGELLAEAIGRMRRGQVSITAGYDGEYGVVRVFQPGMVTGTSGGSLFEDDNDIINNGTKPPPKKTAVRRHKIKNINANANIQNANAATINFDDIQEAIINHTGDRTIIIAGPGTGKTAVLAAKIAKIINGGVKPDSILALSFTVKAATELCERAGRLAHDTVIVNVNTFHSFCCALLREQAEGAGITADFAIADESRRNELLKEVCTSDSQKAAFGKLGRYIEERKRFLLLPGEERPTVAAGIFALPYLPPVPPLIPEMETLYGRYRKRLHELHLFDFDDLIAETARLFTARPEILAEYRRRLRYIFVDEYQDINLSQYIVLRLLADGENDNNTPADSRPSLWVIGDPHQAIYGFRGSDKRFIDRFTHDYPDANRFTLARSFRCAESIIGAACRLTGASLTGTSRPVDIYRIEYPTDKSEAEGVARAISRLIGGASFFAKDSGDGAPYHGVPRKGRIKAAENTGNLYADTAAPGDCAVLIRAAALADPVVKALTNHGIPFEFTGGKPWWEAEPFVSFLTKVRESPAQQKEFAREKDNPHMARLFELAAMLGGVTPLLDALALSDSGGTGEYNREGVKIMTIHAAKGLEFDHVFITGLENGILPFTLYGEDDQAHYDEEQRLMYVAMTRARVGLYLSRARSRNFKGRILDGGPSPFLGELETIIPLLKEERITQKQLSLF